MKVEIWSDIACPFCYIGKRRFETALGQFEHRDAVEVIWRSFQLDPDAHHVPGQSMLDHLTERKGWSLEQARAATAHVADMARGEGIQYNFERQVPANTFNAHRLSHLAAQSGLQDVAEERLFAAYFQEGKDIADPAVLAAIGTEIGLEKPAIQQLLTSDDWATEVQADITEAKTLGIHGVPFFVFNRMYAVSGAQASTGFLQALEQSWAAWQEENPVASAQVGAGEVCTPEGDCA